MRIVHIEDLEAWQCLVKALLAPLGIEMVCFDRLNTGIEFLREHSADIVLLDLELPDSSLYDTIQRFFGEIDFIPVVIISAFDLQSEEVKKLQDSGYQVSAYVSKIEMNALDLLQACKEAIERYYTTEQCPIQVLQQLTRAKEILLHQKEQIVEDDLF